MADTIRKLRDALREETGATGTEFSDPVIERWAAEAILEHNAGYNVDGSDLPTKEEPLVRLLMQIKLCDARAAKAANQNDIRNQSGYGTDRSTPYWKNIDMSLKLRSKYSSMLSHMGLVGATDGVSTVVVGRLSVIEPAFNARVPYYFDQTPLAVPVLTQLSVALTSCQVQWTISKDETFLEYLLFGSLNTILAPTNTVSTTGIPKIADGATPLLSYSDPHANGVELTGMTTGLPYHLVLVTKNNQRRFAYSNELIVTPA